MTYDPTTPLPANPTNMDVRRRFDELDGNMDHYYEQEIWDSQVVAAILVQEVREAIGRSQPTERERLGGGAAMVSGTRDPTGPHRVRELSPQRAHPMFRGDTGFSGGFVVDGPIECTQIFNLRAQAVAVANALNALPAPEATHE